MSATAHVVKERRHSESNEVVYLHLAHEASVSISGAISDQEASPTHDPHAE